MNNPLLSVIIPADKKYIKEAIDSVLAQTYPVYEIIVADDGSTDKTREIAYSYCVERRAYCGDAIRNTHDAIRYIYQPNRGPGAARNKGIKEAKGEYIAFLDADDLWMPEKLEKQINSLQLPKMPTATSEVVMVCCDMSHNVDGKLIYKSYLKEKGYKFVSSGSIYENLLRENFIFTPTVIVKKEILEKMGYFDESYRICEDYKMWLNIAKNYSIGFIDEPLVIRNRHKENITQDKYLFISSGIRLFEEILNSNNHSPKLKNIIKNEYYRRFFNLGYYYWDKGDMGSARRSFANAMKYKGNILKSLPYLIVAYLRGLQGDK